MSPDYDDYALEYEDYFGEPPGNTTPDEALEQLWEAEELERDYAKARARRRYYSPRPSSQISNALIGLICAIVLLTAVTPFAFINHHNQMDYRGEVSAKRVQIQFDENVAVDDYYAEFKVKNKTDKKIEHLTLKIRVLVFSEYTNIYFDEFSLEPKEEIILRTKSYRDMAQEINPYATGKDVRDIMNDGIRDLTTYEIPTHRPGSAYY